MTGVSAAQNAEVSIFAEGLFSQHPTGGLGGRLGFRMLQSVDLEGEVVREFHSETFSTAPGQTFFTNGYQFLAGPRLRLPVLHLFATGKAGVLRSTTHPEDASVPSSPAVTSAAVYIGGGTEIGESVGLRLEAGDELLLKSGLQRSNVRVSGGVFVRF